MRYLQFSLSFRMIDLTVFHVNKVFSTIPYTKMTFVPFIQMFNAQKKWFSPWKMVITATNAATISAHVPEAE